MASQERVEKPAAKVSQADAEELAARDAEVQAAQARPKADTSDTDDLLDEIDGLLEEQDVLTNFRQRGGQAVRVVVGAVLRGFEALRPQVLLRF